jgi:hypothetical protein
MLELIVKEAGYEFSVSYLQTCYGLKIAPDVPMERLECPNFDVLLPTSSPYGKNNSLI